MEFIRGLTNLKPDHYGCVATIGNFDGVHLGHQALIKRLKQIGAAQGLPTLVIFFEPHPAAFFAGDNAPARINKTSDKIRQIQRHGIDRVLCLRFNKALSTMAHDEFVEKLLIEKLGVNYLVVGDDFRFGKKRLGNYAYLSDSAKRFGFGLERTPTVLYHGARVSSTRIREALGQGQLQVVKNLLGRSWQIVGRVGYGQQLGRTLGMPTANVDVGNITFPVNGVFVVRLKVLTPTEQIVDRYGVANLGKRPSVGTSMKQVLEVHLLNFSGDLYRKKVSVEFLHFLRAEQKFTSLEALKTAIHADKSSAISWLADNGLDKTT